MDDERILVEALLSGSPEAPRLFLERFQSAVFAVCVRMLGHRHDAEDVAQEVFLRALRGIRGFDPSRPLRPWLMSIAANRCRTALARRSVRPSLTDAPEEHPDPRRPPGDPDDLAGEVERAVARLRPDYRLVFTMYHEQGLSYEEIAEALARPIGTVKTWLHRARAELADDLARRGVHC